MDRYDWNPAFLTKETRPLRTYLEVQAELKRRGVGDICIASIKYHERRAFEKLRLGLMDVAREMWGEDFVAPPLHPRDGVRGVGRSALVTSRGETHTVAEWAKIRGLKLRTLLSRLFRYGYSVEESLFCPAGRPGEKLRLKQ